MEDLNVSYAEKLEKLNLSGFISLVITLKTLNSIYENRIAKKYYLILEPKKLHKQFIKNPFEFVYNIA